MTSPSRSNIPSTCRRVALIARKMAICLRRSLTFIRNVLRMMNTASRITRQQANDSPCSALRKLSRPTRIRAAGVAQHRSRRQPGLDGLADRRLVGPFVQDQADGVDLAGPAKQVLGLLQREEERSHLGKAGRPAGRHQPDNLEPLDRRPVVGQELDLVAHVDRGPLGEAAFQKDSRPVLEIGLPLGAKVDFVIADLAIAGRDRSPSPTSAAGSRRDRGS